MPPVYPHNLIKIIPAAGLANIGPARIGVKYLMPQDALVSVAIMPGANGSLFVWYIQHGQAAKIG